MRRHEIYCITEWVQLAIQIFLYPFAVRWLWNIIIVPACHVEPLTYWRALGLQVLVAFLTHSTMRTRIYNWVLRQERKED